MSTEVRDAPEVLQLPSDQNQSGRDLGDDEIAAVAEAIESGTLTSTKGKFVKQLEEQFAESVGALHAYASSSGTAALHTAIAAVDPEPGDEIITTSITDMGAITPILYQGAIPVFADVDPDTYNLTADTIEARISERTKAIMVTHLFGNPAEMGPIMELARSRDIPVIEDCAQAFGATLDGTPIGMFGDIGCFSLQQGKHITTGEGGLCVSNNPDLARRMFLFINKAWGYGDAKPDHYFLALNYRMNELTGAVAVAQLQKLQQMVDHRVMIADLMTDGLSGVPGIETPRIAGGARHTYWKYCLSVDSDAFEGGLDALAGRLKSRGVFCAPRYIQKPAFECQVIRDQRTFGASRWPFTEARPEAVDYDREKFAGTYAALAQVLVLPLNEKYTAADAGAVVSVIREAAEELAK
ncbi:MAG: DegT/DnrJ/EryC1/StrS family aminotransferase [Planctomycetota bacterium]